MTSRCDQHSPPFAFAPHSNHQLFSDHYLNHTLPLRADWQALAPEAEALKAALAALYADFTPSDNEAQTEDGLIKPVLKALGHDFEVQPALKTGEGTKRPDYVFYRDPAALNANKRKTLTDALPNQGAYAVVPLVTYQNALAATQSQWSRVTQKNNDCPRCSKIIP